MKMKIKAWGSTYKVKPIIDNYRNNGNLYIGLNTECEPFADLTVNICELSENEAAIDTNNCPWAEQFIEDYSLGTPTGRYLRSGYCAYPVYKFDLDKVKQYR